MQRPCGSRGLCAQPEQGGRGREEQGRSETPGVEEQQGRQLVRASAGGGPTVGDLELTLLKAPSGWRKAFRAKGRGRKIRRKLLSWPPGEVTTAGTGWVS